MKKRIPLCLLLLIMTILLLTTTAFSAEKKVKSIELNKKTLTLVVGKNYKLKANVKPAGANKKVTWKSSNKKVATVSSSGKVIAKKAGKVQITCASKQNPKIKVVCKVTVKAKNTKNTVAVSKITLNKTELTLTEGETETLTATVTPDQADDKTVTWSSSDEKVATVEDGKVEAISAGKAVITCKSTKYPKVSGSCKLTVEADDLEYLEDMKYILAQTGKPLYLRRHNQKVSYMTNSSGQTVWSVGTTANGVVKRIKVYRGGGLIAQTSCDGWGCPVLTAAKEHESDISSLKDGSYNFASDPTKVLIAWGIWNSNTTIDEFEKMVNHSITADVFALVKQTNWSSYYFSASGGGSLIIIYGKNAKGELIGKFAGAVMYNYSDTEMYVRVKGIDPNNKKCYGENYFEMVKW